VRFYKHRFPFVKTREPEQHRKGNFETFKHLLTTAILSVHDESVESIVSPMTSSDCFLREEEEGKKGLPPQKFLPNSVNVHQSVADPVLAIAVVVVRSCYAHCCKCRTAT
jgi:hypothetical protein